MKSKLVFFSNFLKNPKEIASVHPCSKHVMHGVIKHIGFNNAKCIVEFGPGIGNITGLALNRMKPNTKLVCFELNAEFCSHLREQFNDKRLIIVKDSAEHIDIYLKKFGIKKVDYAFSGIPFSLMKYQIKMNVIKKTHSLLRKGGKFIIYQNSQHVKKYAEKLFSNISRDLEVRNFPPTYIFACEKT